MSRELRDFQIESESVGYRDNFNDSSVNARWTQNIVGNVTITEDTEHLTIYDPDIETRDWEADTAPNISIRVAPRDFTARVTVSGLEQFHGNDVGMSLYLDGDQSDCFTVQCACPAGANSYAQLRYNQTDQDSIDLGMFKTGCGLAIIRRGNVIFGLFVDGGGPEIMDMTYLGGGGHLASPISSPLQNRIGLFFNKYNLPQIVSAEFWNFSLTYP
jgi:hypothetical protein